VIRGLEEFLADYSEHFQFYVGWVLLLVVLFLPQGLISLFGPGRMRLRKSKANTGASHGR